MERHIVHCGLDTFFVSVERLINSDLTGKPVLIGGNGDRGVMASCSYEARKYGVLTVLYGTDQQLLEKGSIDGVLMYWNPLRQTD